MMEFPDLFDDPPEPEKPKKAQKKAEEPILTTAVTVTSGPLPPVKEIIRDLEVLKNTLDKQTRHPISMLGEELLSEGFITAPQLEKAIRIQEKLKGSRLGEVLVSIGAVSQETVDFILARRLGVPTVDLRRMTVDPDALRQVPILLAKKHVLLPCLIHNSNLVVAMENPMDLSAPMALRFVCGRHILAVMAPRADIEWAIDQRYKELRRERIQVTHWV